jgi:putative mRNA 3-end processing factor
MSRDLVVLRPEGLYCEAGGFFIDPWRPVDRAVITHAHADHARTGHRRYLAAGEAREVMHARLGRVSLQTLQWGESITQGDVRVSLFPAGHILGSAQVRIEHRGEVWVVSGDYKLEADPTCTAFEPVRCDTFITESTFGLPVYRWRPDAQTMAEIASWWADNAARGRASVLLCYALGKAQRIQAGLARAQGLAGPIVVHGAVAAVNAAYREAGVSLPVTCGATDWRRAAGGEAPLVLAPPSAAGSPWLSRFGDASLAFASGWMRVRGARRRRALDRGFVLSDHADWLGLMQAIEASGARRVIVTHGFEAAIVRHLSERGIAAHALRTEFGGEAGAESDGGIPGDASPGDVSLAAGSASTLEGAARHPSSEAPAAESAAPEDRASAIPLAQAVNRRTS